MNAPELHVVDVGRALVRPPVKGAIEDRRARVLRLLLHAVVRRLAREHDAELAEELPRVLLALELEEDLDELVVVGNVHLGLHEHRQAAPQPRDLGVRGARAVGRRAQHRRAGVLAHFAVREGHVRVGRDRGNRGKGDGAGGGGEAGDSGLRRVGSIALSAHARRRADGVKKKKARGRARGGETAEYL